MASSYSYHQLAGGEEEEGNVDAARQRAQAPQQQPVPASSPSLQQQPVANVQPTVPAQPQLAPNVYGQLPPQQQWQPGYVSATELPFPQAPIPVQAFGGGLNGWALPELVSPRNFRAWRGGLFSIAGDGSSRDWSICCIGACFPYILFGQNMNRALGLKYATQAILYFLCVIFFRWLVNMLAHMKCGYEPRFVLQSPHHSLLISGRKLLQGGFQGSNEFSTDLFYEEEVEYDMEQWARCMYPYTITLSFAWIVMLVFFAYAGYRRIQIRHKFGIPGDDTLDYVSWMFCAPCALCQETRTLSFNNVVAGEWNGPSQEAFVAAGFPQGAFALQAPQPYGMQLHPLNDNGVLGVPMGLPQQGGVHGVPVGGTPVPVAMGYAAQQQPQRPAEGA